MPLSDVMELGEWEISLWWADYQLDPWGERREDARTGLLGAYLCNTWGARMKPRDFVPQWGERLGLTRAQFAAFASAHNERITNGIDR